MNRRDVFRRLFLLPGAVALPAALPGERGACPVVHVTVDALDALDDRAVRALAGKLAPEFTRLISLNKGGAYARARMTAADQVFSEGGRFTPDKRLT